MAERERVSHRALMMATGVHEGGWKRNHAQRAEEQVVCYQLRLQGHSVREVARLAGERLGWSLTENTAWNRIRDEALARVEPEREALLRMELDRLDRYLLALEATAASEEAKPADRIGAVNSALKVQERRAKLLGLDQPMEVHVQETTQEDLELASLIREEKAKQAREEARLSQEVEG
jgi:hypothetical protein